MFGNYIFQDMNYTMFGNYIFQDLNYKMFGNYIVQDLNYNTDVIRTTCGGYASRMGYSTLETLGNLTPANAAANSAVTVNPVTSQ